MSDKKIIDGLKKTRPGISDILEKSKRKIKCQGKADQSGSGKKLKKVEENLQPGIDQEQMRKLKVDALNKAYANFNGHEVDKAVTEMLEFLDTTVSKEHPSYAFFKNQTWRGNHIRVYGAISQLVQEKGYMPTTPQISEVAGLSNETVYKHLREFREHDLYKGEMAKFLLMRDKVLATVLKLSVAGDLRACKIYLDSTDTTGNSAPRQALEQNNYLQINNLKITPDELENLPAETLQQIETLIKLPVNMHVKKVE